MISEGFNPAIPVFVEYYESTFVPQRLTKEK